MSSQSDVDRRRVLKGVTATVLAGSGFAVLTGQVAADSGSSSGCCHECWLDIKPGSCPNSINPDSNGVIPVLVGWPHLDPETVRLVPREDDWGDCSNRDIPEESAPTCQEATGIRESDDGAEPVRAQKVDEDDDSDPEWKFKFETQDLDLDGSVRSAVLVAAGTGETAGCTVWGVDSVNIVGGNGEGRGNGAGN